MSGYFFGLFLFFVELTLAFALAAPRFAGSPKSMILDLMRARNPLEVATVILVLAAIIWLLPIAFRFQFDLRARLLTRERLASHRRMRRRAALFCWVFGTLFVVVLAGYAWLGGWPILAIIAAKFSATIGCALFATGLFSRRGSNLVCQRCDYPMISWRGSPPRCAECGIDWHAPWRATTGIRHRSITHICGGLFLVALSALLLAAFSHFALR